MSFRQPLGTTAALVVGVALFASSACVSHVAPYKPKRRVFDPGKYEAPAGPPSASIYGNGGRGFFEDQVARRIGDMLLIRINENETAQRSATTSLARSGDRSSSATGTMGILGAIQAARPGFDPSNLLNAASDSSFDGEGSIQRSGRLTAVLPVRVRRRLPNGDLFVEGTKVIMVGNEEHHLYVSGIVRPIDIQADNSVLSSRVAEAEIEYTGRGQIADQQKPGWLSRLLTKVWPI